MSNYKFIRPKKKQVLVWIAALRSKNFKQVKFKLQNKRGYCCLGVACELFIPPTRQIRDQKQLTGMVPSHQQHAPKWLREVNDLVGHKLGKALTNMNDDLNYSFDEIADILELVFIHKAI